MGQEWIAREQREKGPVWESETSRKRLGQKYSKKGQQELRRGSQMERAHDKESQKEQESGKKLEEKESYCNIVHLPTSRL